MESNIDESKRLVRCLMELVLERLEKIEYELEEQRKAKDNIDQLIRLINKNVQDANLKRYINEGTTPPKRRHNSERMAEITDKEDDISMHDTAMELKNRMKVIEEIMEKSIADIDALACRLAEVDFRIKYAD